MTPEVNFRECVTYMPPPSVNKVAHYGFETYGRHQQKSKTGVSVPPPTPQKRTYVLLKFSFFNKTVSGYIVSAAGSRTGLPTKCTYPGD